MKFLLICSIVLFLNSNSFSQTKNNWKNNTNYGFFNTLDFHIGYGSFIKNSNTLDNIMDNPYNDFALRIGIQSKGSKIWEQIMNYPVYGMGFYTAYFYDEAPLGIPSAIYFFIDAPLKRWEKFYLGYDLATGLSYGFTPYDQSNNPENNVIGAKKNVYFHLKFIGNYQISNRIDIGLGLGLNHFSNGSTQTPNLGINLTNITLNTRYFFNPVKAYTKKIAPEYQPMARPDFIKSNIPKTINMHELSLYYAAGGKATTTQYTTGPIYFISSLAFDYHFKYYHIARVGIGIDYFYEAARREWHEDPQFKDLTYSGIHLSHILYFDRLALVFQPGFYLSNNVKDKTDYYLRVGGRYDITDKFYIQAALKTRNGATADFIEWGLGYRFIYSESFLK